MKKFLIILLAVSLCLMAASVSMAAATSGKSTSKTTTKSASSDGNLGIGWYYTSSAWGVSANYKLSKDLSVQGIVAPLGWPSFYGVKGNYKFMAPDPAIGIYGYGMAGLTTFDSYYFGNNTTGLGFGGGAGVEYFPGKMFDLGNDNYKKVGFMAEIGVDNMNWDWDYVNGYHTSFGITFNAGMHYYF